MGEVSNFGLARRNLETGEEQIFIVTSLPVDRDYLAAIALERDENERRADPDSSIRWFVVSLPDARV